MAEAQGQVETQPIPQSMNVHEAAGALASLLESGAIQEDGRAGEVKPQPVRDEKGKFAKEVKPTEEAKPEAEAQPEAKEVQQEETQTESETQVEEKPKWTLKLKYRGEDKEVDQDEATELAQKGYDYTQKMQQLAKEREESSLKVKAETEKALKQYETQLETYKKAVTQIAGVKSMPEIEALSRTDPVAAQQEFLKSLSVNQAIQAIEAEQAKIAAQRSQEAQETFAKQAREAVERLQERIPGWNNDRYSKILEYGVKAGFQRNALNAITDPTAIEVLDKARQWDEFQSAKPKTVEKKVPPVAPKVLKPGSAEKPAKANKSQESMAQLQKSGTRKDAEAYVLSLIEEGRLS